jgi:hypothetical protein
VERACRQRLEGLVGRVIKPQIAREYAYVALGKSSVANTQPWLESGFVVRVVRLSWAAPSGRRLGSRMLGLGVDSIAIAIKVIAMRVQEPVLAANPWVGAALRFLGRRDVSVTGIYASPGSRSHRLLRVALKESPVITTVDLEASAWVDSGGRAVAVRYGNSFDYPFRTEGDSTVLRVFVGGSSDRDSVVVELLEQEVMASESPVLLTVIAGGESSTWSNARSTIERLGWVTNEEFGRRLAASDVVFLPLERGQRAAGHMVTVGALEAGVPVVTTRSEGMNGYVDGEFVSFGDADRAILPQLEERARRTDPRAVRAYWAEVFSLRAYISRVGAALRALDRPSTDFRWR